MKPCRVKKLTHEGDRVAEVEVQMLDDGAWGAMRSKPDALKREKVRQALRTGDSKTVEPMARLHRLKPRHAA